MNSELKESLLVGIPESTSLMDYLLEDYDIVPMQDGLFLVPLINGHKLKIRKETIASYVLGPGDSFLVDVVVHLVLDNGTEIEIFDQEGIL